MREVGRRSARFQGPPTRARRAVDAGRAATIARAPAVATRRLSRPPGSPSRRRFPGRRLPRRLPRPARSCPLSPQLLPDHAPALLALADGTVFMGSSIGATGHDDRRGRVQHGADRLPGNPHRSELLPADRHADLSAHRQLRRQRRGRRSRRACFAAGLVDQGPAGCARRTSAAARRSATTCGARARSAIAGIDTRRLTRAAAQRRRAERLHRRAWRTASAVDASA